MQRRRLASVIAISTCLATGACGSDGGAAVDTGGSTEDGDEGTAQGTDPQGSTEDGTAGATHGSADSTTGDSDDHGDDDGGDDGGPPPDELPYDPDQLAEVCARGNADPIAIRLCSDPAPSITSLAELYQALDMVIEPASVALLANSTSLAARSVSAINATRPDELTAEQKLAAIDRLNRAEDAPGHMPPARFATLPDASKQTLLDFLSQ